MKNKNYISRIQSIDAVMFVIIGLSNLLISGIDIFNNPKNMFFILWALTGILWTTVGTVILYKKAKLADLLISQHKHDEVSKESSCEEKEEQV